MKDVSCSTSSWKLVVFIPLLHVPVIIGSWPVINRLDPHSGYFGSLFIRAHEAICYTCVFNVVNCSCGPASLNRLVRKSTIGVDLATACA